MSAILVVDDDPFIRYLVATMLRRANYEVDTATNGRDAIQKAKWMQYNVIVLDLMMPFITGVEVLARLAVRALKPRFVVIMSAEPHDAMARAGGVNVFARLHKPSAINEIVATVGACIAAA